jgi:hypothetical protein
MAFDFSFMDTKDSVIRTSTEPLVKIWNHKDDQKQKNSYFFLNRPAAALLGDAQKVKVGIDTETKKIVITPTTDERGRVLSKNVGGSATISLKALIEQNNLPSKTFKVGFLQSYIHGGIIFSYDE